MAVYINLGIDCGHSSVVADSLEAHFEGFRFRVADAGEVECEVWKTKNHDHWYLGVWPRGLGYGTLRFHRPELLDHEAEIRVELYRRLSERGGFKRALFCGEAYDTLWYGTPEELSDIDYIGMIYSEADFPEGVPGRRTVGFVEGYSIVLEKNAEPIAPSDSGNPSN